MAKKKDQTPTIEDILKYIGQQGGEMTQSIQDQIPQLAATQAAAAAAGAAAAADPTGKASATGSVKGKTSPRVNVTVGKKSTTEGSNTELSKLIKKLNEINEQVQENTKQIAENTSNLASSIEKIGSINAPEKEYEQSAEEKLAEKDDQIEALRKSLAAESLGKKIGEGIRSGIGNLVSSIGRVLQSTPIIGTAFRAARSTYSGLRSAYGYFKERSEKKAELATALEERSALAREVSGTSGSAEPGKKIDTTNKILLSLYNFFKKDFDYRKKRDHDKDLQAVEIAEESGLGAGFKKRMEPFEDKKKGGLLSGLGDLFKDKLPNLTGMMSTLGGLAKNPVTWLVAGIVWAAVDGIKGFFKSKEWGVSGVSGVMGGILGGTNKGLMGAFTGMGKWAMIGAGLGSIIPGVGTLAGGIVGATFGAIAGWVGGKKIAKLYDSFGKMISDIWKNMGPMAKTMSALGISGGPIGIVLGGIIGTVADKLFEWFSGIAANTGFKSIFDKGVEIISSALSELWDLVVNVVKKAGKVLEPVGEKIRSNAAESESLRSIGGVASMGWEPNEKSNEAMAFFQSKGWSKEQAAGIVGNLQMESGNFDPDIISGKRKGDNGKAVGIAQWHEERQKKFAEIMKKSLIGASFRDQLEFVNWELNNTYKSAGESLKKQKDARTAAAIVDYQYEQSSRLHTGQRMSNAARLAGYSDETSWPETTVPKTEEINVGMGLADPEATMLEVSSRLKENKDYYKNKKIYLNTNLEKNKSQSGRIKTILNLLDNAGALQVSIFATNDSDTNKILATYGNSAKHVYLGITPSEAAAKGISGSRVIGQGAAIASGETPAVPVEPDKSVQPLDGFLDQQYAPLSPKAGVMPAGLVTSVQSSTVNIAERVKNLQKDMERKRLEAEEANRRSQSAIAQNVSQIHNIQSGVTPVPPNPKNPATPDYVRLFEELGIDRIFA